MNKNLQLCISSAALLFASSTFAASDAKHFPGFFLGATHLDSETVFSYGLEYEYKFDSSWGAGAVYEETNDAHHGDGVTVVLAALYYHPLKYIRVGIGAGTAKVGGAHSYSENLYRLSANYDYHLGDFSIEPTIAVDFADGEEALVLGVAFVRPF